MCTELLGTQLLPSEIYLVSIFGFGGHFRLSFKFHYWNRSGTLFELAVIENLRFAVGILMISVMLSEM